MGNGCGGDWARRRGRGCGFGGIGWRGSRDGNAAGKEDEAARGPVVGVGGEDDFDLVADVNDVGAGVAGEGEAVLDEALALLVEDLDVDGLAAEGDDGSELEVGGWGLGACGES